jgi:hypothetical protein
MEAAGSFEIQVLLYQNTWRHIAEDHKLERPNHGCDKLKSLFLIPTFCDINTKYILELHYKPTKWKDLVPSNMKKVMTVILQHLGTSCSFIHIQVPSSSIQESLCLSRP